MKSKSILFILSLGFCFWVNGAKSQEVISKDSVQTLKIEKERIKLTSKLNSLKLKIVDQQRAQGKWNEEVQEKTQTSLTYAERTKRKAADMKDGGVSSDKEAKQIAKAATESKKNADNITKLNSKIEKSQKKVQKFSREIKKIESELI